MCELGNRLKRGGNRRSKGCEQNMCLQNRDDVELRYGVSLVIIAWFYTPDSAVIGLAADPTWSFRHTDNPRNVLVNTPHILLHWLTLGIHPVRSGLAVRFASMWHDMRRISEGSACYQLFIFRYIPTRLNHGSG